MPIGKIHDTLVPPHMKGPSPRRKRVAEAASRRLLQGRRWRDLRLAVLAADPLCRECARRGLTSLATEVDHVIPRCERPDLMWERGNLQGLCRGCHIEKTRRENRGEAGDGPNPWADFVKEMSKWK